MKAIDQAGGFDVLAHHFGRRLHGEVSMDIELPGRIPDGAQFGNCQVAAAGCWGTSWDSGLPQILKD